MDIEVVNPKNVQWLWLVLATAVVLAFAAARQRRALARFATANLLGRLVPAQRMVRFLVHAALVLAGLTAMVLALMDFRWGRVWRDVPQKGIEVVFVLDVSRSMLAEDASPNRLGRAKAQISDMVDAMAGDRVGLVVFAGNARRRIPLTSHYSDFKQTLAEIGPEDVERGGSRLGDALRAAADSFLDKTNDHKAIVLLTDGEDMESNPIRQARRIHQEKGIRVFAVGLGDMAQGARIPIRTTGGGTPYLQYKGKPVWTRMHGVILRTIADDTGGAYIPAGTKQVDMADVYHRYVTRVKQQEFKSARIHSYVPRFSWFVGIALGLVVIDTLLAYGKPARPLRQPRSASRRPEWEAKSIVRHRRSHDQLVHVHAPRQVAI